MVPSSLIAINSQESYSSKSPVLFQRFRHAALQLIDIPVSGNPAAMQEPGLVTGSPDSKVAGKVL